MLLEGSKPCLPRGGRQSLGVWWQGVKLTPQHLLLLLLPELLLLLLRECILDNHPLPPTPPRPTN
jgi:hypothetical protein